MCTECLGPTPLGERCPECAARIRTAATADPRPAHVVFGAGANGARGYVTVTLIAINVVVAVVAVLSSGSFGSIVGGGSGGLGALLGSSTPLHQWGALVSVPTSFSDGSTVAGVSGGEYYRLLTSMFLHFGLLHLALNMYALWIIGRPLEAALGPARFLALYLVAGFGGSVAVYLFTSGTMTAGASGAIFGLFAALVVVLRRLGRSVASVLPILLVNLAISFVVPGISLAGHLGGLVVGALIALGLAYAPGPARARNQLLIIVAIAVVLIVITVARTASLDLPAG